MKQFIINPDVSTVINLDTGNHSAKIKNHRGQFLHISSFSIELERGDTDMEDTLSRYFSNKQPKTDVVLFVLESTNKNLRKNHGLMIGKSALTDLSKANDDDTYNKRYDYKVYFTSRRYQLEVLGYIASALFNHKEQKYDKSEYEIVLNLGVPSDMDKRKDLKDELRDLFKGQTFTIETVMDHKGGQEVSFDKIKQTVTFKVSEVYVYAQPFGALCSLAFTQKGTVNSEYARLLTGKPFVIDIGYGSMDTTGYDQANWLENLHTSSSKFTMKALDDKLSKKWKAYNQVFENTYEVRKFRESGATTFKKLDGIGVYAKVEDDIHTIWEDYFDDFKYRIKHEWGNFGIYDDVVFAGGTGKIFYDKIHKDYADRTIIAKAEQVEDDILSVVMAITEGYSRLYCAKKLQSGELTENDFIEVEAEPVIKD